MIFIQNTKNLSMEKLCFENADGERLHGVLDGPRSDKCIILLHGLSVDKDEIGVFPKLSRKFVNSGFTVFRFDFAGSGESEGKSEDVTISGESLDVLSALNFLRSIGFKKFGLLAASFAGGPTAISLTKARDISCVVFWNALIDYSSVLKPELPWTKKHFGEKAMMRLKREGNISIGRSGFRVGLKLFEEMKTMRPWELLMRIKIPIIFIHGSNDTYVPLGDSKKYAKLLDSRLVVVEGAEHGFRNAGFRKASNTATDFFRKNM